jgi:hypothetical protein
MAASPIVEVKDGAGSYVDTPGGINVAPGNTISIRLKSTTDVSQWTLQIFGVDEVTATAPALTGVNGSTHVVSTPATVVTFTMPAGVGVGRALAFRSSVNGGGTGRTTTFGIYTLTSLSNRVGAVGERFEANATFGWAATVNKVIRAGGGGGGGLPPLANLQYAVLMEDPVGILTFQKLTMDMIDPSFAIDTFGKTDPDGGTLLYRRGDEIAGVTAEASYLSGAPSSASIDNTYGGSTDGGDTDPGVWSLSAPYETASLAGSILRIGSDLGADPTWTATLSADKGSVTDEASFTVRWTRDVYWGVGTAGYGDEAEIEGLSDTALSSARNRTLTVSPSSEKVYYAYPKAYGTATFTLNGFPASFDSPSEVSVTNGNGVTSTYYLYESTNLLTGSNLNFVVT